MPELPRVLHDAHSIITDHLTQPTGVVWRLDEIQRQLDANVLNLAAGQTIGVHADPDLDVLLVILGGSGSMTSDAEPLQLAPGKVFRPGERGGEEVADAGDLRAEELAVGLRHRQEPIA